MALGIRRPKGYSQAMKKALAALLFCLLTGSAGYPDSGVAPIVATAVPLDPADPAHRVIGGLRYLAGWQLTSRQPDFGGYSSLRVDGDHILALSDNGKFMRFRMATPGVIDQSQFGELPAFPTYGPGRSGRDSESMTFGPEGDIWIGFEGQNAILRYARDFTQLIAQAWPPAMHEWSANSGPEAMARLAGGSFLVFAEGMAVGPATHMALLFPGDPTNAKNVPVQFGYRPPKGYVPTDAQQLPDGRVVILHRRFGMFDGFSAAVAIIDPKTIRPGAVIDGALVAELTPPLSIDNMEGISVTVENGRTILWMISDDNQIPIERTLLLKFELVEGRR